MQRHGDVYRPAGPPTGVEQLEHLAGPWYRGVLAD
jgi:hypothetical protein